MRLTLATKFATTIMGVVALAVLSSIVALLSTSTAAGCAGG